MLTRRRALPPAIAVSLAVLAAACGGPSASERATTTTRRAVHAPSKPRATSQPDGVDPGSTTDAPGADPEVRTTTPATTEPATAAPPVPSGFTSTVSPISANVRARMDGRSMRPRCPVRYADLRYLTLTYLGFDGKSHHGEMVVHADVVHDVVTAFEMLFAMRYPIRRMTLVDDYGAGATPMDGANDFASIEADNTSAFNCRARTGSTTTYSEHAFGRAIDLNPLENPYVTRQGTTSHPASRRFLDRTVDDPAVITAKGHVVAIFASIGWGWGGSWSGIKDLQHFSRSGK